MLVYEKKVDDARHLFGTMSNIPGADDVQLTYKDDAGASLSPTLEDKFFDDGHGGIKMVHDESGTVTEKELNVFIGDTNIIPGDFIAPEYTVTVTAGEGGTAVANPVKGVAGTEVTLTITPADGKQVDTITATPDSIVITNNKFTIGTSNVAVEVTFKTAG